MPVYDPPRPEADDAPADGGAVTPDQLRWTHEALERVFDLPFLDRCARAPCVEGRFAGGRALQDALLGVIRQLRPAPGVAAQSPAWRTYNALNLRYAQGLSQAEVAAEVGVSVRHFKRIQDKAVYAAAALVFEPPAAPRVAAGDAAAGLAGADVPAALPARPAPEASFAGSGREYTRLDDLVRLSLTVMEPLFQQQNLRLRLASPAALPVVQADRILARQLFISALSWLAHGLRDVDVAMTLRAEPHHVAVILARPPAADAPGSGAGSEELETVRQLAEAMRATVRLGPAEPDGAGLAIAVRLPVSVTRAVLLVEDNADAVELVQRYLEGSGEFHVVPVRQAGFALRQAAAVQPACILLDVMMPEHDGWEVLGALKADPETAGIPVVISSVIRGYDLARALGADAVLPKPYSAAELVDVLRRVTAST